jgi:hypothetical protein
MKYTKESRLLHAKNQPIKHVGLQTTTDNDDNDDDDDDDDFDHDIWTARTGFVVLSFLSLRSRRLGDSRTISEGVLSRLFL